MATSALKDKIYNNRLGYLGMAILIVAFLNDFCRLNVPLTLLFLVLVAPLGLILLFQLVWFIGLKRKKQDSASENKHSICFTALFVSASVLSAVLSHFQYMSLLNPTYNEHHVIALAFILAGYLAFFYVPQAMTIFYTLVYLIGEMNFFGENAINIINSFDLEDTLTIALLFIVGYRESPKKGGMNALIYLFPKLLSIIIYSLSGLDIFRSFYLATRGFTDILWLFLVATLFIVMVFVCYKNLYVVGVHINTIALYFVFLLFLPWLLPPVKAMALEYREIVIGQHLALFEDARRKECEDTLDLRLSDWLRFYDEAADAGNPFALLKSAVIRLEGHTAFGMDAEKIEKAMERLYLSAISGNPSAESSCASGQAILPPLTALEYLLKYEKEGIAANISVKIRNELSDYSSDDVARYYASLYLARLCIFDLGFAEWDEISAMQRQTFISKGTSRLERLRKNPLSAIDQTPGIYLALISGAGHVGYGEQQENSIMALEKIAEYPQRNNQGKALYTLGQMYMDGELTARDEKRALGYLQRAHDAGNGDAGLLYAASILDTPAGTFSVSATDEARFIVQQLSDAHHPGARIYMALRYISGKETGGLDNPAELGRNMLLNIARLGDATDDVPRADTRIFPEGGLEYLPNLFGKHIVTANYNLALFHFTGEYGFEKDMKKSLEYLEKETQKYHPESIRLWGSITATLASEEALRNYSPSD